MKRVDTSLHPDTIESVSVIAKEEGHSSASMLRKLIMEALNVRKKDCLHLKLNGGTVCCNCGVQFKMPYQEKI